MVRIGQLSRVWHFNPRIRVGCDFLLFLNDTTQFPFQSTHPRRMRPDYPSYRVQDSTNFNPRIRVGCDVPARSSGFSKFGFQSTHPRRMRPTLAILLSRLMQFQSTHPRRMRLQTCGRAVISVAFQSTHPRRMRPTSLGGLIRDTNFNPRIRVGCDLA